MSDVAPTKMGLFSKKPIVATAPVVASTIPEAYADPAAPKPQDSDLMDAEVEQEIAEEAQANITGDEDGVSLDEEDAPLEAIFAEPTHQEASADEANGEEIGAKTMATPFPSLDAKYLHGELQHTFFQHKGPVNVRFVMEVAHKRMLDMDVDIKGKWVRATSGQMESIRRHLRDNLAHILATETHGIIANDEAPEWSDVPAEKPAASKPGF